MDNKKRLNPEERYLVIEALKRWSRQAVETLDLFKKNKCDTAYTEKELQEINDLIGKFEEGVL